MAAKQTWRQYFVWIGRRSLTVAWGYVLILAGVTLDVFDVASYFLNATEVQTVITAYAGPYASHVLKIGGLITVLVRLRTLKKG